MTQKTEQALNEYLKAEEKICWHGVTEAFPLLGKDAKSKIVAKWASAAVLIVAGLVFCMTKQSQAPSDFLRTMIGVVVVAGIFAGSPLLERWSLMRQEYWITDQRVLMMGSDRAFYSIPFAEIDGFYDWKGHAEGDCIVIGSVMVEDAEKQLRWRACHPKTPQGAGYDGEVVGLIMYCISDAQGAIDQLQQHGVLTASK